MKIVVIFCAFLAVNKSHEKTNTNNKLAPLTSIARVANA